MRQGTTPTYTLIVSGYNLTVMTVFVTVRGRHSKLITKTGDALSIVYGDGASTIAFALSQEDTFALGLGSAEVQVRFIDVDGTAYATDIAALEVLPVLLPGVIEYGGGGGNA